jgi:hypothetical protein
MVVTERGFGVHQLWGELIPNFPHFHFKHGYGLGVLAVGKDQPEAVMNFLQTANAHAASTRELFSTLGRRLQVEVLLADMGEEIECLKKIRQSRDYQWGNRMLAPLRRLKRLLS